MIGHGFYAYQAPKNSIVVCDVYYPYSIKVFSNGTLGLCNASGDLNSIRGNIREICENIDRVAEIFPEKKENLILNEPCAKCREKCLCGGVRFCRQHSMCEYNEIDIETFLKTYIDLVKNGTDGMLKWN